MNEVTLNVSSRGSGKRAAKDARQSGRIPGVYYRKGSTPIAITSDSRALRPVVYTKDVRVVKLHIDGASVGLDCILKDVTFDPVTDVITHFDLHGFQEDAMMHFEVPVRLVGTAIGAREGGVIQHVIHKLDVKCMPKDLPSHIDVDITPLRVTQSVHIGDLKVPNVVFTGNPELGIVSLVPPRVEEKSAKGPGGSEPELVSQKGKKDDK